MTTVLQLNQGIMELCVTNKLPECYIKVQSGVLYLISPCGDIIARLMNLATTKINIKDIPFIFEKVKNFITTNLEELSEFFRAKKENKVQEYKILANALNLGALTTIENSETENSKQILYVYKKGGGAKKERNTVEYVYSNGMFCLSGIRMAKDDLPSIPKDLKELQKLAKPVFELFEKFKQNDLIVANFKTKYANC